MVALIPRVLILFTTMVAALSAGALELPERPRLTELPPDAEHPRILQRADHLLEQGLTVPQQAGDWIFYYACPDDGKRLRAESPLRHVCPSCGKVYTDARTAASYRTLLYNRLEREMRELALAYAISGEARYAEPVRDAFLELARLYPTFERHDRWGRTGLQAVVGGRRYAQHLDEAASAITLAQAYDLIAAGDTLTEAQRQTIGDGFLGRTVREIQRWQWAIDPVNNHRTWFNAAYAQVGVAIGDEELLRAAIHDEPGGLLWQLGHSVTADGIWYEGTMAYHFYALQAIIHTLDAAAAAGWRWPDNERLRSLWLGPLRMAYPDGSLPVINDSDPANLRGRQRLYDYAARYFDTPTFADISDTGDLASAKLPGIGLVALRRGPADARVCLFADYGIHGGHHGHPDKLNITLFAFGRELVLDPGRLTYSVPEHESWARTTVAHNTVVVNGANQQPDTGELLLFETSEAFDACLIASAGAYPGYPMRRWLVLGDTWLLDLFTIAGEAPAQFDWLLHLQGELTATGDPIASLGNGPGYQHLDHLRELTAPTTTTFQSADQPLALYHWPPLPTFAGTGIGYRVNQRVPFILRRVTGTSATFLTLYDLSPEQRHRLLGVDAAEDQLAITFADGDARRQLVLPMGKAAMPTLAPVPTE